MEIHRMSCLSTQHQICSLVDLMISCIQKVEPQVELTNLCRFQLKRDKGQILFAERVIA